ncbi:amino acid ABC transporter permease [Streptococcus ruminantium]|uniref:Amino acid ABC transporter permease n=1 Tax=Streptococcus ruminantium TaxID=1917441 RepID=A0ABU1B6F0_9STRE|nr:amino acid ABC transporter permease [Streptococcus ruminantium]MDQ8759760.1 amino acid ABC transporter permease [Streptococcus ruminantium]MDQ8769616.1 amino acid ABC transporter permease [Streptococcus ruminantium]MDQ8775254.1 amino acid ABC transporter permease [Streptococcus ruminantium]MDQ8794158.1 amino acid ABC transporter permease [Streptococcus ruminantium]MDQ8796371.1 amino acid ABC transporter permease [Streptococcus ruminantium]
MNVLTTSPYAWENWIRYFNDFPIFFQGFLFTLAISVGALIMAMLLGIVFGSLSSSKNICGKLIARIYVEYYQNTPLLVQFMIVYYGLPLISNYTLMPSIYWTAVICVGLYHGAYIAEVIRAGIEAVPLGQTEAALSQGFTPAETMRMIQAIPTILPPLTNQVVNLIKNTATVAIISGADIMFMTKSWSAMNTNYIPAFTGAAFLYFIMCFPVASWGRHIEEKNKTAFSH